MKNRTLQHWNLITKLPSANLPEEFPEEAHYSMERDGSSLSSWSLTLAWSAL
jgi:hypothetical protein